MIGRKSDAAIKDGGNIPSRRNAAVDRKETSSHAAKQEGVARIVKIPTNFVLICIYLSLICQALLSRYVDSSQIKYSLSLRLLNR